MDNPPQVMKKIGVGAGATLGAGSLAGFVLILYPWIQQINTSFDAINKKMDAIMQLPAKIEALKEQTSINNRRSEQEINRLDRISESMDRRLREVEKLCWRSNEQVP